MTPSADLLQDTPRSFRFRHKTLCVELPSKSGYVCLAGVNDNGNISKAGVIRLGRPELPSVHHGHPDVENDDLRRRMGSKIGQGFLPIGRLDHAKARPAQRDTNEHAEII